MLTIGKLLERVIRLDTDRISFEALDNTSDKIAEANARQLLTGTDATGGKVGYYRNEVYAEMKNRMNPAPGFGVVDLRLTGAFQSRLVTNIVGDNVVTESTDEKAADLEKKYGSEIYGLSSTFKAEYIDQSLRPEFNRKITDAIGLKFK